MIYFSIFIMFAQRYFAVAGSRFMWSFNLGKSRVFHSYAKRSVVKPGTNLYASLIKGEVTDFCSFLRHILSLDKKWFLELQLKQHDTLVTATAVKAPDRFLCSPHGCQGNTLETDRAKTKEISGTPKPHGISVQCPVSHGRSLQAFLLLYR